MCLANSSADTMEAVDTQSKKDALPQKKSILLTGGIHNHNVPLQTAHTFFPMLKNSGNGKSILECYWNKGIYPSTKLCKENGCFGKHRSKGLCERHYEQFKYNSTNYVTKNYRESYRCREKAEKIRKRLLDPNFYSKDRVKKYQRKLDFGPVNQVERRWRSCRNACLRERGGRVKWNLSLEAFRILINKNCFYCDNKLGNKTKFGTGLDRINSLKGYEIGNIVPCCVICNRIKGHNFTVDETQAMVKAVISKRFEFNQEEYI
jgi:hypothetical protein